MTMLTFEDRQKIRRALSARVETKIEEERRHKREAHAAYVAAAAERHRLRLLEWARTRTCAWPGCRERFLADRRTQKYHSRACANKASNVRRRERRHT